MSYLDVIGPGTWLIMDGTDLSFYMGLLIFCFAAIIITIVTLLVILWIKSGNKTETEEAEAFDKHHETETKE